MAKVTFTVRAKDHNGWTVEARGFDDGEIVIENSVTHDGLVVPAEVIRQIRAKLENQALDRLAAWARERSNDLLVARDSATDPNRRRRYEAVATAYREMTAKALDEKETA